MGVDATQHTQYPSVPTRPGGSDGGAGVEPPDGYGGGGNGPSRKRRWRNRMPLIMVIVLTVIGFGTAIYDAFAPTTEEPLNAQSHAVVQHACDTAYHTLKALPPLAHSTTRTQLETRILEENRVFDTMVAKFGTVTPTNHDGLVALRDWTADWRAMLTRRVSYVGELRATPKHINFLIPIVSGGGPITDRMNQYSRTHELNQCLTENLQLETVDAIRQYPTTDT
ncbi:MAG TPA: hypothetical protein VGI86_18265, partial [Acidimicrobiia bacterium]